MYANIPRVEKILKKFSANEGCTYPLLVQLSDGRKAVYKYPNNCHGPIVLINEYIAHRMINAVGLSSPSCGIAFVDDAVEFADDIASQPTSTLYQGKGFFSEYINKAVPISFRATKHAQNLHETCRLVLFDHILMNCDRYPQNLLLDATNGNAKFYAIDHSHVLGDPDWTTREFPFNDACSPDVWQTNFAVYDSLIHAGAPFSRETLIAEGQHIQECLPANLLYDIFAAIPREWLVDISPEKVMQAQRYILTRIQNIASICQTICEERGYLT